MSKLFIILTLIFAGKIIAQPVTITFYTEKHWTSSSGTEQYDFDKPATSFIPGTNTAPVYIGLEFINPTAITAKDRLMLGVYKKKGEAEEYAYSQEMGIPKKKQGLKVKSNFTPGEYVARIYDKDNESSVFGTASFSVGTASLPDYKHNNTFVACASVNDDWNPVGEKKSIKAGSCTSFLYKASKSQPVITHYAMIWSIRRIKTDGSEDYVNDLQQMVEGGEKGWRFLSTDNVCEFSKPGTYRIYLFDKETSDSHHGVSDEYYGMMEFKVE